MLDSIPSISFGAQKLDDALERWRQAIIWAMGATYAAPLFPRRTPAGMVVSLYRPETFPARITTNSGGGVYAFEEVYESAGGLYTTKVGGRSGDAYEWNGNDELDVPLVVEVRRIPMVGEYRFQMGSCS